MITPTTVILISWATFIIVWGIGSFTVKRDIKGGGFSSLWVRLFIVALVVFVFVLVRTPTGTAHFVNAGRIFSFESHQAFLLPAPFHWPAAILVVLGAAFAMWARIYLGRNWSAAPAMKEGHELVTSGPYHFVRHPIYTGLLVAVFGSALAGTLFAIGIFIVVLLLFYSRIKKEEKIMLELFPNEYPAYRARTKRLIPFVW